MSAAPAIAARGLGGGYEPGVQVLSGLDFTVPAGSMVAVLGPNAGGKTTLFKALLGDLPERKGEVEVAAPVAYVPQTERYRLDFPVSALDVVLMGAFATAPWYRPLGHARRERAREALGRVGLAEQVGERFGSLSGGQRQRTLIARALVQEANVLLLDEPLSGVDRPAAERILALLGELRQEGRAILVSSHDIEQARRFDAVLCVNGRQVFYGPPEGMTPAVLGETYGAEIVVLEGGERAIVVQHHHH
ncbi:MAG TPA: metal ABC transporter ATP-binding protein [Solirubrobacterales bacterium]|nr:metal ABC transporter ATP-binding protein [Solirubrobacterales bacterium]